MQAWRFQFAAMGSDCEVHLVAPSHEKARALAQFVVNEVGRIECKYSRYRPDSIVSRINLAAGSGVAIPCDEETWCLFDTADRLYRLSAGLFDITSGVLRRVWDFGSPRIPSSEEISSATSLIGWPRVERTGNAVYLPQDGMEIDFGGFGKEYAADRAVEILLNQGVKCGYVNLGGDIRVMGPQANGEPWVIGVQNPRQQGELAASISVFHGALATSGDAEKFFEIDGQRYCHIINPTTGYSVRYWQSVSVLAEDAVTAGSMTTIAMLLESRAIRFLEEHNVSYFAIDQAGNFFQRHAA